MCKTEDLGAGWMLSPPRFPPLVTRTGLWGQGGPKTAAPQSPWSIGAGRGAQAGHGGPPSWVPTHHSPAPPLVIK